MQKPVLKTFEFVPNSFFKLSKEGVWSDIKHLKNQLPMQPKPAKKLALPEGFLHNIVLLSQCKK